METKAQRVLIAQPDAGGHRLIYIRMLIDAALAQGCSVTVLVGFNPMSNGEFEVHLKGLPDKVTVIEVESINLRLLRNIAVEVMADHVVMPDGDALALQLGRSRGWRSRCTLSILVVRDPTAEAATSAARWLKLSTKSALIYRASRLNGVRLYRLKSAGTTALTSSASRYISDPVTVHNSSQSVAELRREWGLRNDIFWFGVIGTISDRKNLALIATCIRKLDQRRAGLVIAGRVVDGSVSLAATQLAALRDFGVQVVQVDRTLSDVEIDSAVAAVNCLVLLHSTEGPSGMLGKAAAIGTRIVAGGSRSLRADTEALGIGTWVPLRTAEIVNALTAAMHEPSPVPRSDLSSSDIARLLV